MARRPLAHQLPALLGGRDEAARNRRPGGASSAIRTSPAVSRTELPGIDELAELVEDAVVVSTADPFHHGIGYGDPPERSLPPDQGGLELARRRSRRAWSSSPAATTPGTTRMVEAKSDARDAGQVFRYLRGELSGQILDMAYTDASECTSPPPHVGRGSARRVAARLNLGSRAIRRV